MGVQGRTWLLSLSGFIKQNPPHLKARTVYPSLFSPKENTHKHFPGS